MQRCGVACGSEIDIESKSRFFRWRADPKDDEQIERPSYLDSDSTFPTAHQQLVEDASASQARCTCYGRDTEAREAYLSEKHNEIHDCCHGDSSVS